MRAILATSILIFLSGCMGGMAVHQGPATYALSVAPVNPGVGQSGALHDVEVESPSWIDITDMQYRLSYLDRLKRESYATSRWVASPARQMELQLRQTLLSPGSRPGSCRLRVELDEFLQVFEAAERSHVIVEARVALVSPRVDILIARQRFRVTQVAGADARSGVLAFDVAVRQMATDIEVWLNGMSGESLGTCRRG